MFSLCKRWISSTKLSILKGTLHQHKITLKLPCWTFYQAPGEFFSEWDHERKTVTLHDTVPNKPKYCNWPEGGSPFGWLVDVKVPAQWSQFHVSLAPCKPRFDLYSDGEVSSSSAKALAVQRFLFLQWGGKIKTIPNPFTEAKYQYSLEEKEKKKKKKLYQKNIGEATVTVKASAVGIRHALCLLCNLINSLT